MLRILAAAVLALAWPGLADAGVYTVGTADPVLIDIPGTWGVEHVEGGIRAESEDGELVLTVTVFNYDSTAGAIETGVAQMLQVGFRADRKSIKYTKTSINDLFVVEYAARNLEQGEPAQVHLAAASLGGSATVLVTAWGSDHGAVTHADALVDIIRSLKRPE